MKIALFIPSMNGGGAERVIQIVANGLVQYGVDVDLVLNKVEGSYLSDLSPKVNVIDLNSTRALKSIAPLAIYLRKNRPDVILSAMNYVNIITIIAKYISRTKTKVFISEHNNLTASMLQKRRIDSFILKSLMKLTYTRSNGIIAVSNGVADALVKELNLKRQDIKTIYNPVVTEKLFLNSAQPMTDEWFLKNSKLPIILGVGRFTNQKDFKTLIKAFSIVKKQRPCNLVILGEGPLRKELENDIKRLGLINNVYLPGFVENPYQWMANSDIFVLSSIHEGFGNVLVEAMACGASVVSTNCPSGPNEILENGKWGKLVPIKDPISLSEAILNTLDTPPIEGLQNRALIYSDTNSVKDYFDTLVEE